MQLALRQVKTEASGDYQGGRIFPIHRCAIYSTPFSHTHQAPKHDLMKTSYRVAWHAAILLACFAITSIWGSSGVAASPPTEAGIPSSLASFVKANNSRDTASVTECFSKDAVVYDDGRIMRGTDEIRQWIAELFRKFQYVVAPSNVRELTNGAILTATITGNFPGASVSLDYHCRTLGDQIDVRLFNLLRSPNSELYSLVKKLGLNKEKDNL
jgi:SnoaL-like domain